VSRFSDNGDGTVSDNLTGLIWLQDARFGALAGTVAEGEGDWATALSAANALADGTCGLADSSSASHWRLPNITKLHSLVDLRWVGPALPDTAGTGQWSEGNPFTGVQSDYYWSSTTTAYYPVNAWVVHLSDGVVGRENPVNPRYVWPVRGGQ